MKKDLKLKAKTMAKKTMLEELKQMMKNDSKEPFIDGIKKKLHKVTVMSDSPEGLEKGLSKAEKILKAREEMMEGKESEKEESGEEMDEDELDEEELDEEEKTHEGCPICGAKKFACGGHKR